VPVIYVTSSEPGSGKTGVAAAISRHYAYLGVPTKLARVAGDERAGFDASYFASLPFVPGTGSAPVEADAIADPGSRDILVVEGPVANIPPGARVVLVGREAVPAVPDGAEPAAIVVTAVANEDLARMPATQGEVPVIALAADRTLAGFAVDDVRNLLNAETLVDAEIEGATCDNLVIAPIGSDAGQPYFRRFQRPAIVVRYDKTDMHLAALRADPVCLVLTGGRRPSEYSFDAARASGVPMYLSRADTENTVIALEGIFDHTRFQGEAKLDRMAELLEGANVYDALAIEVPIPS
jgi:BioD-like phosphotransacetylase family protein